MAGLRPGHPRLFVRLTEEDSRKNSEMQRDHAARHPLENKQARIDHCEPASC
jgi:hypothetical protein